MVLLTLFVYVFRKVNLSIYIDYKFKHVKFVKSFQSLHENSLENLECVATLENLPERKFSR